jgi:hypothetical protein
VSRDNPVYGDAVATVEINVHATKGFTSPDDVQRAIERSWDRIAAILEFELRTCSVNYESATVTNVRWTT